jgi:hypothetical protein
VLNRDYGSIAVVKRACTVLPQHRTSDSVSGRPFGDVCLRVRSLYIDVYRHTIGRPPMLRQNGYFECRDVTDYLSGRL